MAINKGLRKTHSSPGVYFTEQDLTYATKSLGVTSLGLVGETEKGPAFQAIKIDDWAEYVKYFGNTNPTKFKGSQYPKYELPYIAKEYLKESRELQVVRVLGLSGTNAGPAWILSAFKNDGTSEYTYEKPVVIGVLRSRGEHKKAAFVRPADPENGICDDEYAYDEIEYFAQNVKIGKSDSLYLNDKCNPGFSKKNGTITISANNYGTFTLFVKLVNGGYKKYAISLNPWDKNYIYNVLGGDPEVGDAEIYVEELYDVALQQLVEQGKVDSLFKFNEDDEENKTLAEVSVVNLPVGYKVIDPWYTFFYDENNRPCILKDEEGYPMTNETGHIDDINKYIHNLTIEDNGKYGKLVIPIRDDNGNFVIDANTGNITWDDSKAVFAFASNGSLLSVSKTDILNIDGVNYKYDDTKGTFVEITKEELENETSYVLDENGNIIGIGAELHEFSKIRIIPKFDAVQDLLTKGESTLTRKDVGKRYLYSKEYSVDNDNCIVDAEGNKICSAIKVHVTEDNGLTWVEKDGEVGHIYTVVSHLDETGTRHYYYGEYAGVKGNPEVLKPFSNDKDEYEKLITDGTYSDVVECIADGVYYMVKGYKDASGIVSNDVAPITLDMNNYKESYRYASTPWIVSEFKGSANDVELTKLFRFHTISDGAASNTEVKVSIENIDPTYGTFDVVVRDFYDNDTNVSVVERYSKCDLVPGSPNYIAMKIGSFDESYEIKSKYITVEVNESDKTMKSIPCGFLGYPTRNFEGNGVYRETKPMYNPYLAYNTIVDEDLNVRKQYFGMSDLKGIDEDVLKYKGAEAYNNQPEGLTPCFHLDSRIFNGTPDKDGIVSENGISQKVTVDGIGGYRWSTVSKNNIGPDNVAPQISTEADLIGTIYEDKRFRKFTVCFYGGWDGWDYYRTSRSIGDEFTYKKYRGKINGGSGEGANFSVIRNPEGLNFENNTKLITSDYYAYLGAIRQFSNPNTTFINVLATPGIDYVNAKSLVNEVVYMVEEDRAKDTIYITTTPDKPFGYSDSELDMYTPYEAVVNLEDSEIDSSCVATYYPWVKFYDQANTQYIYLPVTKDVVRSIALTDNIAQPWYAAAGWNRGSINAIRPKKKLKINEQDELYDGRINFVNSFAQEETDKLWGDKNLQIADSQLNRLSKRRALIRIKQLLANAGRTLLFDPNDPTMGKTLQKTIETVMDSIVEKRGCSDYKVIVDDSPETRDRLELNAQLYIKLNPNLEYINISLIVTPQGFNLSEV